MTKARAHSFEDHTGELRVKIDAPSLEELFAEAGRVLAEAQMGQAPLPEPAASVEHVDLRAHDCEALLVDWLNELLFRSEVKRSVYVDLRVERVTEHELSAAIRGSQPLEELRTLVKAATLHDMKIRRTDCGLTTSVVFDI
jgi:SHS2 domain-containing protein